jgi:hypothetical protein
MDLRPHGPAYALTAVADRRFVGARAAGEPS